MTDFRHAMKAVSKGNLALRPKWNGSGLIVKGKNHPLFMQNGTWERIRYEPSWEDLFSNDWVVTQTKPDNEENPYDDED